ncbi:MAG TPA: hypothetical protein PKX92_00820 [Edaphocola sp.]|nr:hypothetical protein [Edaphocola sp.]
MKATIALMGKEEKVCGLFIEKLIQHQYPLVFIDNEDGKTIVQKLIGLKENNQEAYIEIQPCQKEACWEADLIVLFLDTIKCNDSFFESIKVFATQKTIVLVGEGLAQKDKALEVYNYLRSFLPKTNVVLAFKESEQFEIIGEHPNSVAMITEIFEQTAM